MREEAEIHVVTVQPTRASWGTDSRASTELQFAVDVPTPGRGYGTVITAGGEVVLSGSVRLLGLAQRPDGSNFYYPKLPGVAVGCFSAIRSLPADKSNNEPGFSASFEVVVYLSDDVLTEVLTNARNSRYPHTITFKLSSSHATNPTGECVLIDWPAESVPAKDLSPILDIEFRWVGEDIGRFSERARIEYERKKVDDERRVSDLRQITDTTADGIAQMRADLVRELRLYRTSTVVLLLLLLIVVLLK
jgi:hypothetical protein